jgi:phosphate:Na+ symporter
MIGTLLGGLGLFLLGMVLMTDGLKAAAGDALRRGLETLTGGAGRAMLSGMAVTALVQSSSATVLTTIGFVSAGLLTFNQAVGVIFGANLGTTSTGWIVSLLGLKVSVSAIALPLVGLGALARFLLRGRASSLGLALAGFGLIFVGIDFLQLSMGSLAASMDPEQFPGGSLGGRALLVLVGAAMTFVLKSSSAAMATTLTAVNSGTIDLDQATMLVIGQNLGTAVTTALATVGASVPAKRTGLAHILFNVVAGLGAFALAPLFLYLVQGAQLLPGVDDPAVALAAFHTAFNLLGVLILLPITPRFGALVIRMVPERGAALTRNLDPSVAEVPAVAVEVARRTVLAIASEAVRVAVGVLRRMDGGPAPASLAPAVRALGETRTFLRGVRTSPSSTTEHGRHLAVLHALDHLDRLTEMLEEGAARTGVQDDGAATLRKELVDLLEQVEQWLDVSGDPSPVEALEARSRRMAEHRRQRRIEILEHAASGAVDPDEALERLEGLRWLDRLIYHVWRAVHHLAAPGEEQGADGSEVYGDAAPQTTNEAETASRQQGGT